MTQTEAQTLVTGIEAPTATANHAQNSTELDARLEGVRTARIFSFFIDYGLVLLLCIPFSLVVGFLGLLSLGAAWALYPVLPGIVAAFYLALTMGGPEQATPGMRLMGVRINKLDGTGVDPFLAVLHGVAFWLINFSLIMLLVSFFSSKKRLAHDILLGTYVSRN